MNRKRVVAVLAISLLGLGSAKALAEENPLDFKQSANAWVAWTDTVEGDGAIFAARREGDKWGDKFRVSPEGMSSIAPAIALDAQGNPWVAWSATDGAASTVYLSRFDGEKWTPAEAATAADDRDDVTPALAFDAAGRGLLVWGSVSGASSEIRGREWNGQGWGAEFTVTEEDSTPDMVPTAAFIGAGSAVVAWAGFDGDFGRIFAAQRDASGKWGKETAVTGHAAPLGEDLPALKAEGESLRLFFEEENRMAASSLTEKGWTGKKAVDLSNAYYEALAGLPGEAQGRAWFAWINPEGISTSFRYNVVTHDVVLRRGMKTQRFAWLRRAAASLGGMIAWVFEPSDALAARRNFPKIAFGDSIVAGRPGSNWVPIWGADAINRGVPGQRAINLANRINNIPGGAVAVILCGTNDAGDGRSPNDILNSLNGSVGRALSQGARRCFLCTNIPRRDFAAGRVEALAELIRRNASNGSIDTFRPLSKRPERFTIDGVGHLNDAGARKVGSLVRKRAK